VTRERCLFIMDGTGTPLRLQRDAGPMALRLFRSYDLVDLRLFGLRIVGLFIGLAQELVEDACTLLLLDPSLVRFLLFGEELVVYFPAH
jgi:hypothetical protein